MFLRLNSSVDVHIDKLLVVYIQVLMVNITHIKWPHRRKQLCMSPYNTYVWLTYIYMYLYEKMVLWTQET